MGIGTLRRYHEPSERVVVKAETGNTTTRIQLAEDGNPTAEESAVIAALDNLDAKREAATKAEEAATADEANADLRATADAAAAEAQTAQEELEEAQRVLDESRLPKPPARSASAKVWHEWAEANPKGLNDNARPDDHATMTAAQLADFYLGAKPAK